MKEEFKKMFAEGRKVALADRGDPNLGALSRLPGKWINAKDGENTGFEGRGWNMIALPFHDPNGGGLDYRLLVNQYNEVLEFDEIDGPVPNRGIDRQQNIQLDQSIFALDYQQAIVQIAVADFPITNADTHGPVGAAIHHEPGFFLAIKDQRTEELDIARLATIPHGDSVLAMGQSSSINGKPAISAIDGRPIGATTDLEHPYLAPYNAFSGNNKFLGLFDVVAPHELLQAGIDAVDQRFGIKKTSVLHFDTKFSTGGIVNIPFVVKQANATEMVATFWVMELDSNDDAPKWAISYAQVVMLEFFRRFDNEPGLIKWPHVSINTLVLDGAPKAMKTSMPSTKKE